MTTNNTAAVKITNPVKGGDGIVKLYVHDNISSGTPNLIYRPGNMVEALQYAFSLCLNAKTLETAVEMVDELMNQQLKVINTPTAPTVENPPVVAVVPPAPVVAPAPVSNLKPFNLSALPGMDKDRASRWLTANWDTDSLVKLCNTHGMINPGLSAFRDAIKAVANGTPVTVAPTTPPAPVVKVAATPPVAKVETTAPVVAPVSNGTLPASYSELFKAGKDKIVELSAAYGVTLVGGRGSHAKNATLVWEAIEKAGNTVPKMPAAPPAPKVETAPAFVEVSRDPATGKPTTDKVPAPAKNWPVGTLLVAMGDGTVRLATDKDILAAMESKLGSK